MAAEKADKRRALWTKVERGGQQISGLLIDCRRVARVWKTHGLKHWPGLDRATWGRWAHCPVLYVPENLDLFSRRPEWSRGNERAKEPRRERLLSFNRRHQERGRGDDGGSRRGTPDKWLPPFAPIHPDSLFSFGFPEIFPAPPDGNLSSPLVYPAHRLYYIILLGPMWGWDRTFLIL